MRIPANSLATKGRTLLFVGLACFLPASFAELPAQLRAKDVLQRIDEEGAKAVIGDSEERWGELATQIQLGLEAGQEEWAEVARRLAPSSDAGSADDLQIIISRALPKSPRLVLGLVGSPPLSLSDVCNIPFDLEDDTAIKRQYLLAAEEALVRLDLRNEPDLEEKRKSCLQHLRSAKCYVFDCAKGRAKDG